MRLLFLSCIVFCLYHGAVTAQVQVFSQGVVGDGASTVISLESSSAHACSVFVNVSAGDDFPDFPVWMGLQGFSPNQSTGLGVGLAPGGSQNVIIDSPDLTETKTLAVSVVTNNCHNLVDAVITYNIPNNGLVFSSGPALEVSALGSPDPTDDNCFRTNVDFIPGKKDSGIAFTGPGAAFLDDHTIQATLFDSGGTAADTVLLTDNYRGAQTALTMTQVFGPPEDEFHGTAEFCLTVTNPNGGTVSRTAWFTSIAFEVVEGRVNLFQGTGIGYNEDCTPDTISSCLGGVRVRMECDEAPLQMFQLSESTLAGHTGNFAKPKGTLSILDGESGWFATASRLTEQSEGCTWAIRYRSPEGPFQEVLVPMGDAEAIRTELPFRQ